MEHRQQIEELFHAAQERAADERADFLTRACAGDEEMRQEVEALLTADEQSAGFPDPNILGVATETLVGEEDKMTAEPGDTMKDGKYCPKCDREYPVRQRYCPDDNETLFLKDHGNLIGKDLGKYRIIGLVGYGGMGAVYKAYNLDTSGEVAVKVILKDFLRIYPLAKALFEREAKLAGGLNHVNIARVYDAGESENTPYIIMEWIDGYTLSEELAESNQLAFEKIVPILDQITSALKAAHTHNPRIIHRDLKPSNIMFLVRSDVGKQLKVMDFGLAKALEDSGDYVVSRVVGTPDYMSPEQRQRGNVIDEKTDIYSLGVILYEMLTGRLPSEATERAEKPLPLRNFRAGVPARVEELVFQMLDKEPDKRPPAREVFDRFIAAVKKEADVKRPASLRQRLFDAAARFPRNVIIPIVMLVAFGVAVWGMNFILKQAQGLNTVDRLLTRQRVFAVALSPDGQRIASAGEESVIRLWQANDGVQAKLEGLTSNADCVAISPDGRTVAAGSSKGTICLWRTDNGSLIDTLSEHKEWVFSIGFSRDGRTLISASADGTVGRWELNGSGKVRRPESSGESSPLLEIRRGTEERIISVSPDLRLVALSTTDGAREVELRSLNDNSLFQRLKSSNYKVSCGVFSLDGQLMALGGEDGTVRIYQVSDGGLMRPLNGPNSEVSSVVFDPNGRMIAAGYKDGTIKLWWVTTGGLLKEWKEHSGIVGSVAFSADGRRLASGSDDQTIRLWQIKEKTQ